MNFSYNSNRLQAAYNANTDLQLLTELNRGSAREQMNFQKMMSDTAHQREVADLQRAGLNPALSLNNGASTSAGAYSSIDSGLSSARMQNKMQDKNIKAQLAMNDKSLENAYKIAEMQEAIRANVQQYNTDKMYELGLQQSKMSYDAQLLGFANAFDIQRFLQSNENTRFYYGYDNPKTVDEAKAWILRNSGALDSARDVVGAISNDVDSVMNTVGLSGNNNSGKGFTDLIKKGIKYVYGKLVENHQEAVKKKELEDTLKAADKANRKANGYLDLMTKDRSNGSYNYKIGYNPNKHDKSRRTSSAK